MGVGHAAVALGAAKFAPRLNVAWLFFAAFLADFLLGIFILAGLEHASFPADMTTRHYALFTFPWSHGLVPLLLWGTLFGALAAFASRAARKAAFWLAAALVVSHFFLDGLVHVAGLPILGENSPKLGLGLWRNMPLELALESLMTLAAIALYWKMAGPASPRLSRYGIALCMLLLAAMTWSALFITAPPPPQALAYNCLIVPVFFAGLAWLLDRKRVLAARAASP
ncbi:MAG TPA: hypothetical protein VEH49_00010 [Methylomirabilota bacterium]|nr:hypothetical protein [Methylomirabilota bacterium]